MHGRRVDSRAGPWHRLPVRWMVAVVAMSAVACGGATPAVAPTPPLATSIPTVAVAAAAATQPAATQPAAAPAAPTALPSVAPVAPTPTAARVAVTARATRQNGVPTFTWDPVAGATGYGVVVFAPGSRRPVWVWTGSATQVRYGALPDSLADLPTPAATPARTPTAVATGLEWLVVATAADGQPVAFSQPQKLP
jgi:hypothetical protein